LLRLAGLTGDTRYEHPARPIAAMLAPSAASQPTAFAHLLDAIERLTTSPLEIAVIGELGDPRTQLLRSEVYGRLLPASVTLTGTGSDDVPLLAGRDLLDGVPTAYVCEHYACRLPVTDAKDLRDQLDAVIEARQQAAR
jgi:uncharacterized protein YyaL (SSP411 family)